MNFANDLVFQLRVLFVGLTESVFLIKTFDMLRGGFIENCG